MAMLREVAMHVLTDMVKLCIQHLWKNLLRETVVLSFQICCRATMEGSRTKSRTSQRGTRHLAGTLLQTLPNLPPLLARMVVTLLLLTVTLQPLMGLQLTL